VTPLSVVSMTWRMLLLLAQVDDGSGKTPDGDELQPK